MLASHNIFGNRLIEKVNKKLSQCKNIKQLLGEIELPAKLGLYLTKAASETVEAV